MMSTPLLELEGTAEEIQQRLADFAGQRLHVIVQPAQTPAAPAPDNQPRKLTITEKNSGKNERYAARRTRQDAG